MKYFKFGVLLLHVITVNACLESAATTVHIQNHEGPIYVAPGENRLKTLINQATTCDNRYPTVTNQATTCDNHYPMLTNHATTCDPRPILHSSTVPYHSVCETDCKCVTKHQTCVPVAVNSVPQNSCTPGCYCHQFPEGYSGYVYPTLVYPDGYPTYCSETDASSCPRISETLIPLLKTYLSQGSGTKHCPQCGQKNSQYH